MVRVLLVVLRVVVGVGRVAYHGREMQPCFRRGVSLRAVHDVFEGGRAILVPADFRRD